VSVAGGAGPTPAWLASLRQEADVPPRCARLPLLAGGAVIGSVEPDFLPRAAGEAILRGAVALRHDATAWEVLGDPTQSLHLVAQALARTGMAGAWRNEQLAVCDPDGRRIATVERAAVRPLGITTAAVHLVGHTADGRIWVQQRALDKSNDPGLWDTLMGGMVSAADTLAQALARETWEEAGLQVQALRAVTLGGRVTTRRQAQDGGGAGYVVEHIDWFHALVPDGMEPVNQDGEVAQFQLVTQEALVRDLAAGAYTTEAALILADFLRL
jgi:8-oxo-dGTP pyrophosphatase MutT (NUDIX family)